MTKNTEQAPNKPAEKQGDHTTPTQADLAQKAMDLKAAGEEAPEWQDRQTDTAGDGPLASRNEHEPVMGAFDAEGQRPALERSRKVR